MSFSNMDCLFITLLIYAAFLVRAEAKPHFRNADLTVVELPASTFDDVVATASRFGFGGFGFQQNPFYNPYTTQQYSYEPMYQNSHNLGGGFGNFNPYYGNDYQQYPVAQKPTQPQRRYPNRHGRPIQVPVMQQRPVQQNSHGRPVQVPTMQQRPVQQNPHGRPIQVPVRQPGNPISVPTSPPQRVTQPPKRFPISNPTRAPIQVQPTTEIPVIQPKETSTATPIILPTSAIDAGRTSTTTEEPVYDIDIRIDDK